MTVCGACRKRVFQVHGSFCSLYIEPRAQSATVIGCKQAGGQPGHNDQLAQLSAASIIACTLIQHEQDLKSTRASDPRLPVAQAAKHTSLLAEGMVCSQSLEAPLAEPVRVCVDHLSATVDVNKCADDWAGLV